MKGSGDEVVEWNSREMMPDSSSMSDASGRLPQQSFTLGSLSPQKQNSLSPKRPPELHVFPGPNTSGSSSLKKSGAVKKSRSITFTDPADPDSTAVASRFNQEDEDIQFDTVERTSWPDFSGRWKLEKDSGFEYMLEVAGVGSKQRKEILNTVSSKVIEMTQEGDNFITTFLSEGATPDEFEADGETREVFDTRMRKTVKRKHFWQGDTLIVTQDTYYNGRLETQFYLESVNLVQRQICFEGQEFRGEAIRHFTLL